MNNISVHPIAGGNGMKYHYPLGKAKRKWSALKMKGLKTRRKAEING